MLERSFAWLLIPMLGLGSPAGAFEARSANPDFTVTVPGLPDIAAPGPSVGAAGGYKVTVIATRSQGSVTPRECAGTLLRSIVAQPGMPGRDYVYRAPLSEKTFLVIYILQPDAQPATEPIAQAELHAHLLSSASGTHCVDVHVSRPAGVGEDEDDWRKAFTGARIEEGLAPSR